MKPADWVLSGGRLLKADFEHHNFGGGEPDIVDPACDLASAIFEFQLAPDAEQTLLETYAAETGDSRITDRLPLYKILYAMNGLRAAKYWLARKPDDEQRDEWNQQFTATRSFAAFHMARYLGRTLAPAKAWERRLCFLDLDGVLDWGLLGFPHTTPCGVRALQLFQRNRFSVVLNTARSLEHVREYCRAYKLPGGVAELGSVFWDAIREWEVPLIDGEAVAQIERLRDEIRGLPGAFIDAENRYSIRAYRFHDGYMRPLKTVEVETVLERAGCDRLTFVQSRADTYIVQKGAGKGQALATVQAYLGCSGEPVAAIGDSAPDVEMLRAADIAFAPANASREVRELVARGECRRTSRPLQAGLLEAAMELCLAAGHSPDDAVPSGDAVPVSLLDELLQVPDRHPVERVFSVLRWRGI
jgi:hydroxymethylpyrimidine pyrophosphatase-like HAD family hydrolase